MSTESLLIDCVYFLAATLTFVPLFRALGLGSTLGYLTAGLVLGPDLLGFIDNDNFIFRLADFGLILLLFVIGLELSPRRLSQLKNSIIGDGLVQFSLSSILLTFVFVNIGYSTISSIVLACAFSLSSTAFVLSYLKESKQLTLSYGKSSFGILLFQDLIIIPLLTLIPFMSASSQNVAYFNLTSIAITGCGLIGIALFGHYALKPLFSFIHRKFDQEIFLAACLLLVLGTSFLVAKLGLSKALGAFMAGIFLSDFEFKKDVENVITPFKGMLLGTFFMSFGLQFDISFIKANAQSIFTLTLLVLGIKSAVLLGIGRVRLQSWSKAFKLSLLVSQSGEFGFVVLSTAFSHGILTSFESQLSSNAILISLFLAPVFARISNTIHSPSEVTTDNQAPKEAEIVDNVVELPSLEKRDQERSKQAA